MEPSVLFALFILILSFLGLSWFAGSDAPFVPTKRELIGDVLKKAGVKRDKIFYELGSGDGRVVLAAAKMGAEAYGVEQSWLRVWYSRYLAKTQKLKNAFFYHGSIYDRSYFPADYVYIYMLQDSVDALEGKLKKELKKGAVVITQRYHFKHWTPYNKLGDFYYYKK